MIPTKTYIKHRFVLVQITQIGIFQQLLEIVFVDVLYEVKGLKLSVKKILNRHFLDY